MYNPPIPAGYLGCDKALTLSEVTLFSRVGKNGLIAAYNNTTCVRPGFTNAHLCTVTLPDCTKHYKHIHIYQSTFVGVIKQVVWTLAQLLIQY